MSWQKIEGKWRQFAGEMRVRWSKLSERDLDACMGNRSKLIGKLQELYDMNPEQAERAISDIEDALHDAGAGAQRMYGGGRS